MLLLLLLLQRQSQAPWCVSLCLQVGEGMGVLVERCRYLEQSGCASICINSCKVPTQVRMPLSSSALHPRQHSLSCCLLSLMVVSCTTAEQWLSIRGVLHYHKRGLLMPGAPAWHLVTVQPLTSTCNCRHHLTVYLRSWMIFCCFNGQNV